MNLTTTLLATKAGGTQSIISMVVIYAAIIAIFWFFAIRPQKKQQKEHDALVSTLAVGDSILTTSGFFVDISGFASDSCPTDQFSHIPCQNPPFKVFFFDGYDVFLIHIFQEMI